MHKNIFKFSKCAPITAVFADKPQPLSFLKLPAANSHKPIINFKDRIYYQQKHTVDDKWLP